MNFDLALKKLKNGQAIHRPGQTRTKYLEINDATGEIERILYNGKRSAARIISQDLTASDWKVYKEPLSNGKAKLRKVRLK